MILSEQSHNCYAIVLLLNEITGILHVTENGPLPTRSGNRYLINIKREKMHRTGTSTAPDIGFARFNHLVNPEFRCRSRPDTSTGNEK
jgi:hypothetical protein